MKLGRRGTTALEFAIVAPTFMMLMFGGFEYARLLWTKQAMQLAGDLTARCSAIASSACPTPTTYAATLANNYGAVAVAAANVTYASSSTSCTVPSGNTAVQVTITLNFTSPFSALVPSLLRKLVTTSCYPTSGY